jgi:hypothetical protein
LAVPGSELPVASFRNPDGNGAAWNLFGGACVLEAEDVMRAYLANLTPKARVLLALPLLAIAYPVITILVPSIIRAVIPDVVRSVLSLI